MAREDITLLHPGDMGAAVGNALVATGHRVHCMLAGRSPATRERATRAGLSVAEDLPSALAASGVVLSICPPHAAVEVAQSVAACGFRGLYIDGNAISPATARAVGAIVEGSGARFVDGGIFGGPPTPGKRGRMQFSGAAAADAARLFAGSVVDVVAMNAPAGAASALKACYAAWTKGTWLHLTAILALAQQEGVEASLREEWSHAYPELLKQLSAPSLNPAKAWRWLAEMEEIAATFEAAGLPGGTAAAGAELCRRLERFKDDASRPSIEQVAPAARRRP
jgi:3-hydroxyisobutyrate dehydrogenase-like beta-hydroxyacid dehydrogenase